MPVYNHAPLVPQAIQAVIDQTYANWELIVVNDGSGDDFVTAIRPFLIEPRIRFRTRPTRVANGPNRLPLCPR